LADAYTILQARTAARTALPPRRTGIRCKERRVCDETLRGPNRNPACFGWISTG